MFNHETMLAAVEEYEKIHAKDNADNVPMSVIPKNESGTIVVKSFKIAKKLCTDFDFFSHLIGMRIDREDEKLRRHVWIFRRDEKIDKVFKRLVENAREARKFNNGE